VTTVYYDLMDTPIGPLRLVAGEAGLRRICFRSERHPRADDMLGEHAPARLRHVREQLDEFFAGERRQFDLVLDPVGTPFQRRAWHALCDIPYGETRSYLDQARALGQPNAVRAVGAANGRNPLPIVIPCHRVIGRDGALVGFGGGLQVKSALLALEARQRGLFG
jgi:methylated-DNA-[protein]-cysteine S-methyltransferase